MGLLTRKEEQWYRILLYSILVLFVTAILLNKNNKKIFNYTDGYGNTLELHVK